MSFFGLIVIALAICTDRHRQTCFDRCPVFDQNTMELPLEKKTGTNFGPPGNCKLVYFLDDLNLPEVRHQDPILHIRLSH